MRSKRVGRFSHGVALMVFLVAACRPFRPSDALNPELRNYLETAIETIRENALAADSVEWGPVSAQARRRAAGLDSPPELYPVLRFLLAELRDGHSFLQLSDELRQAESRATGMAPQVDQPVAATSHEPSPYGERMEPESELLRRDSGTFGFLFMPQGRRDNRFATSFQQRIDNLAQGSPCGWIVDVRGNGGGDMWPMLAALGPLLGEGDLGRFVRPGSADEFWAYRAGRALHRRDQGEEVLARVEGAPVPVLTPLPPVAVLIDRGTASSGEAIAISFRSRAGTRSFGEHSYGASTATRGFKLPDGANLVIAVSTFGDTRGNVYLKGIAPDEPVAIGDQRLERSADPVIDAAIGWLSRQPACSRAARENSSPRRRRVSWLSGVSPVNSVVTLRAHNEMSALPLRQPARHEVLRGVRQQARGPALPAVRLGKSPRVQVLRRVRQPAGRFGQAPG